jgi:ABC-type multidrug transport system ATPase subunit
MRANGFTKTYDGRKVLDFPGMELESGKIYAVIGANGSGKSTFAKCLAGIIHADKKGTFFDKEYSVGYMPQKSYPFAMSVEKNIALGGTDIVRRDQLMDKLQITHLAKKKANRLSGGETARMALARVFMKSFDVLILDEPTAAMDVELSSISEDLMKEYCKENGCALVLITHSLQQAKRVADEVLFFYKGELKETGAKEQILYAPKEPETKRFLEFYGV